MFSEDVFPILGEKKKKEHQYLLVLIYVSLKISEKRRAATQSNTEKM